MSEDEKPEVKITITRIVQRESPWPTYKGVSVVILWIACAASLFSALRSFHIL